MATSLYSRDILRLASSLVHGDAIEAPDGSAEVRSAVCGSIMAVDVVVDNDDKIRSIAIRANACALGQASAAILRANVAGISTRQVADMRARMAAALSGDGHMPSDWTDVEALAPARDVPARHAAILLPYDALLAAAKNAREKADVGN